MIVIGDVHGKVDQYLKLLARHTREPSVQLGDFGIGFAGDGPLPPLPEDAWLLRGNHDNPEAARAHSHYLGDYGVKMIDGIRLFYVSGAWSSDQWRRTEGLNWWRDEELSSTELEAAVELYTVSRPHIVLTHDGPEEAVRALLAGASAHKSFERTRTGDALNAMVTVHRPKTWIFGHWHTRFRKKIEGTEYRCLPELEWCRIKGDFQGRSAHAPSRRYASSAKQRIR